MDKINDYIAMCDNKDLQSLYRLMEPIAYSSFYVTWNDIECPNCNCEVAHRSYKYCSMCGAKLLLTKAYHSINESYQKPSARNYDKIIWVPNQNELQVISGLNWCEFDARITSMGHKIFTERLDTKKEQVIMIDRAIIAEMTTRKKLGLQVVMKEKCSKRWDKDQWVWIGG